MPGQASVDPSGAPARPSRKGGRRWVGWVLAAAILLGCLFLVDLRQLREVLLGLTPAEIAILIMISTADRLLMGYKWGLLLRLAGTHLPIRRCIRIFYQANFSGTFLPSHVGGDVLRAWWVIEDGGDGHVAAASLLAERLLGLAAAINWALLGGTVFAISVLPEMTWLWILGGVAGAIVANACFVGLLNTRLHAGLLGLLARFRSNRVIAMLHRFASACAEFGAHSRGLAINFVLSVLEQALQMLLICSIAVAIGIKADPIAFAAGTALYMLLVRVPVAPDGWGVGELAAIWVFGLIGVGPTEAFTVGLVGHVIPMLAVSPGLLFLLQWRATGRDLEPRRP